MSVEISAKIEDSLNPFPIHVVIRRRVSQYQNITTVRFLDKGENVLFKPSNDELYDSHYVSASGILRLDVEDYPFMKECVEHLFQYAAYDGFAYKQVNSETGVLTMACYTLLLYEAKHVADIYTKIHQIIQLKQGKQVLRKYKIANVTKDH